MKTKLKVLCDMSTVTRYSTIHPRNILVTVVFSKELLNEQEKCGKYCENSFEWLAI